jgi:hypothetical protein
MLVVGFDLATVTGCADGEPGSTPRCFTWNLGKGDRPHKLALLYRYFGRYLAEQRPDAVFYERPLPLGAGWGKGMSDDTATLLRGAIGLVEALSCAAALPVRGVTAAEVRRYILGPGRLRSGEGKQAVWQACRALKWPVHTLDESDAAAVWAYGCGMVKTASAHASTPLFARRS